MIEHAGWCEWNVPAPCGVCGEDTGQPALIYPPESREGKRQIDEVARVIRGKRDRIHDLRSWDRLSKIEKDLYRNKAREVLDLLRVA